ncbi:hypothetical protein [Selenomonas sp. AB3002]|uniref:hypothetical protein n=1 Tax=Selenomonas sp. AB3002 TaxID=1392502 RepID=UPI0004978D94
MKDKIQISKLNNKLHFYLVSSKGRFYLFTQRFSKGVYHFFIKGRSESEILSFKHWSRNPRLDKTIEKLPIYITYVRKEFA